MVAYDSGDNVLNIFPSENTKFISELSNGSIILDKNTAIAVPKSASPGFSLDGEITVNRGANNLNTGTIDPIIIDPGKVKNQEYELTFLDMSNDSVDNNYNGITDFNDLSEKQKITTYYSVKTKNTISVNFISNDTLVTDLGFKNIIESDFKLIDQNQNIVSKENYRVDYSKGKLFGTSNGYLGKSEYTAVFNYHPIYMSPYIENTPWDNQNVKPNAGLVYDTQTFEGIQIKFQNHWTIEDIESSSYWSTTEDQNTWSINQPSTTYFYSFSSTTLFNNTLTPLELPNDYLVVFDDSICFGNSYDLMQFAVSQEKTSKPMIMVKLTLKSSI